QRSSVRHHQGRRFIEKCPVLPHPALAAQIERNAGVNASLPDMPVDRAAQSELVVKLLQIAQIWSHLSRGNGRVFPSRPMVSLVGRKCRSSQAPLANFPKQFGRPARLSLAKYTDPVGCIVLLVNEPFFESCSDIVGILLCIRSELDEQPRTLSRARQLM